MLSVLSDLLMEEFYPYVKCYYLSDSNLAKAHSLAQALSLKFVLFLLCFILYRVLMNKEKLNELVENFALFDDWEERYRYLIDLGRTLPQMDEALKSEETLVRGCTSRVWIKPDIQDGKLHFFADSDAHIVRGLIAILDCAYQGIALNDIACMDIEGAFAQIGLEQNLSPNRRNGFFSMVERIKSFAS